MGIIKRLLDRRPDPRCDHCGKAFPRNHGYGPFRNVFCSSYCWSNYSERHEAFIDYLRGEQA